MLEVELANRWGRHGTLGPNRVLKLDGPTLKLGRQQQIAGEHIGDGWLIDGRVMTRLEILGPLLVHFERNDESSAPLGPFDFVLIVNDYVFTGDALLACFSRENRHWQMLDAGQAWPTMVLAACNFLSVPDRHRMIAEAAYFLAQARGFAPGGELDDWLEAEREIDTALSRSRRRRRGGRSGRIH